MLIAVIPTMDVESAVLLVNQILNDSPIPDKIFIINNTEKCYESSEFLEDKRFIILNQLSNIGVNPSLNKAMDLAEEMGANLSFLNDDICIANYFFLRICNIMDHYKDTGILCPSTTHDMGFFLAHSKFMSQTEFKFHAPYSIVPLLHREGWAVTLSIDLIRRMPRIPEEMKTFCGDDWVFEHAEKFGFGIIKDLNNIIYHKVGSTLKKHPEIRDTLLEEKREFNRITGKVDPLQQ
jgi:GT2 family glycosyltransferase